MKPMSKELKKIVIFTITIIMVSIAYAFYVYQTVQPIPEQETFISEIGEAIGELALWLLVFIYVRTALKLILGKGALSKRIMPYYSSPIDASLFKKLIRFLDKTHIYFGIATVAIIILHIVFLGMNMQIYFFPAVLVLVIWQGLFGLFISWKYSTKGVKKLSFVVHAQLFTGIMIGLFSWFGHLLID